MVFWAVAQWAVYAADPIGKPVSEFPPQLRLPESGLSLITDFQQSPSGTIAVYFVNRSGGSVTFEIASANGEGDAAIMPLMLLEFQNSAGEWKRAQRYDTPWCGNSSRQMVEVQHDHFLPIVGRGFSRGQPAKIRYAFHGQKLKLASNVGEGSIYPPEAEAAKCDDLAFAEGDFTYVASLAAGRTRLELYDATAVRLRAIAELGSRRDFDRGRAEQVLQYVASQKLDPYSSSARKVLSEFKRVR